MLEKKYVRSPGPVEVAHRGETRSLTRVLGGVLPVPNDWLHNDPLEAPGKVGRDHPATSKLAAKGMKFGSQRHHALTLLGKHPMTAAEVATSLGRSRNQTAARLLELREVGYVRYVTDEHGETLVRDTDDRGNKGMVQEVTSIGRRVLRDMGREAGE